MSIKYNEISVNYNLLCVVSFQPPLENARGGGKNEVFDGGDFSFKL